MALLLLATDLIASGAVRASESVEAGRTVGHPRDRLPLTVHLVPPRDATIEAAVHRAVDEWNAVAREALGVEVFRWHERPEGADVIVRLVAAAPGKPLGLARFDVDNRGVIRPPIRVELVQPVARGETSRETVVFQVAAHEIGHALGLPHTDDPGSIMCCLKGAVNLGDPAVRARYVEARRHPEVRSARRQLLELYPRFWQR